MTFHDLLAADFNRESIEAYLRSHKFRDIRLAAENLIAVTDRMTDLALGRPEMFQRLFEEMAASADPDRSLNAFERILATHPTPASLFNFFAADPRSCAMLCRLCAASEYLTRFLFRKPELLDSLADHAYMYGERTVEKMVEEARGMAFAQKKYEDRRDALRRFKQREMLRIGGLDILEEYDLRQVCRALSDFADATLQVGLEIAWDDAVRRYGEPQPEGGKAPSFCVLGMGKLGSRELNYSSDVDVIFICDGEGKTAGPNRVENAFFFSKVGEKLVDAMGANTEEGYVFRIDTRLRPEGSSGALARFADSAVNYYRAWGAAWERQALLKARPCAGDLELGARLLADLQSFIFRPLMADDDIEAIKTMRRRTEEEAVAIGRRRRELKRGFGGIRDIEFIVQFFQLMLGHDRKRLRSANTLDAIDELVEIGRLDPREGRALWRNYIFLRTVEHRIMILNERQSHSIPDPGPELEALARRLGYEDMEAATAGQLFMSEYERAIHINRDIYLRIFPEDGIRKSPGLAPEMLEDLLNKKPQDPGSEKILAGVGFQDPAQARHNLAAMAEDEQGYQGEMAPRRRLLRILDRMIVDFANAPDPDMALNMLEQFSRSFSTRSHFFETLESSPKLIEQLIKIGGFSPYLSKILVTYPEFFETAANADAYPSYVSADDLCGELAERVRYEKSDEARCGLLGRLKRREFLRLGVRDILGAADVFETMAAITAVAEATVRAAFHLIDPKLYGAGGGDPERPQGFAVVAMGKMGGGELHYRSDLDVVFVSADDLAGRAGRADHIGERLMKVVGGYTPHGRPFEIDARLRPEGNKGPLAPPLSAFKKYFEKDVEPWERLAYTRARFIAGDEALGAALIKEARRMSFERPLTDEDVEKLRHVKRRIENERLGPPDPKRLDVKIGRGGLIDIEFSVQFLQLVHGGQMPEIRKLNTWAGLNALAGAGLINEERRAVLADAYAFLKRVESRMQIVEDVSKKKVSLERDAIRPLARRLEYAESEADAFADKLVETMRAVREIHEDVFYGGEKQSN